MEKSQKLLLTFILTIFAVAIGICIYLFFNSKKNPTPDSLKIKNEYEELNTKQYLNSNNEYVDYIKVSLSENNIYTYTNAKDALSFLKNGTGLIAFCSSKNMTCRNILPILNDVGKENKLKEIKYLDIDNIRDTYEIYDDKAQLVIKGTDEYNELLQILDSYLDYYVLYDSLNNEYNTGKKILLTSTIVAVNSGKITGLHNGVIDGQISSEKLTDESKTIFKNIYQEMIDNMNKGV